MSEKKKLYRPFYDDHKIADADALLHIACVECNYSILLKKFMLKFKESSSLVNLRLCINWVEFRNSKVSSIFRCWQGTKTAQNAANIIYQTEANIARYCELQNLVRITI